MPNEQKQLRLTNKKTAAIIDGHQIFVNDSNGDTIIMFFQLYPTLKDDKTIEGEVVSNIHINYEQTKMLIKNLQDNLKSFETKIHKK